MRSETKVCLSKEDVKSFLGFGPVAKMIYVTLEWDEYDTP